MLAALLVIALAVPLLQGKVRKNALYGVRFPESFKSDEAWYAINRYGALRSIIWAIVMAFCGVVIFFLPLGKNLAAIIPLAFCPLLFVAIPVIQTKKFAKRYAE